MKKIAALLLMLGAGTLAFAGEKGIGNVASKQLKASEAVSYGFSLTQAGASEKITNNADWMFFVAISVNETMPSASGYGVTPDTILVKNCNGGEYSVAAGSIVLCNLDPRSTVEITLPKGNFKNGSIGGYVIGK